MLKLKHGLLVITVGILVLLLVLSINLRGEKLVPEDSPKIPERGFFMGILPTPA